VSTCPACGSENLFPMTAKPPQKHGGPCTPECETPGLLCLDCRLWHPKNER
jgi:hypothetical protein